MDDPDYDLAIAAFTRVLRRSERFGFDQLAPQERVIFHTWQFVCEINNGGFHQYFFNSAGEFALETVAALEKVDMPYAALLLRRALAAFPNPAKQQEVRNKQLRDLPEHIQRDLFEELTAEFFDSKEDPYALQAKFVRRNLTD